VGSEGKQEIGSEGEGRDKNATEDLVTKVVGDNNGRGLGAIGASEPKPAHDSRLESCDLLHLQHHSDVSFSSQKLSFIKASSACQDLL